MRRFLLLAVVACASPSAPQPRVGNTSMRPAPLATSVPDEEQILAYVDRAYREVEAAAGCAAQDVVWRHLARDARDLVPVYRRIAANKRRLEAFQARVF